MKPQKHQQSKNTQQNWQSKPNVTIQPWNLTAKNAENAKFLPYLCELRVLHGKQSQSKTNSWVRLLVAILFSITSALFGLYSVTSAFQYLSSAFRHLSSALTRNLQRAPRNTQLFFYSRSR